MLDKNRIHVGHSLTLLGQLPDNSVHSCITSPPFFNLRDYNLPPSHWPLVTFAPMAGLPPITIPEQECCLGLEKDLWSYVGHLVAVFREVKRVLHPTGVLWCNLGDSYSGSNMTGGTKSLEIHQRVDRMFKKESVNTDLPPKNLMLIPHRVALALQADGWYLRSDCPWLKCLSGGTWIYTRTQKGDMPMMVRDVARLDPRTVKLWNGEKWTQVLGWSRIARKSDELEIVLRSGERISCTPTHRFPTSNRGLLSADELQVGDILQSVNLPEPKKIYSPSIVPNEAAWFIGLYLAEGSRSGGTIQITGHVKEIERLERVKKIAEFYGGSATVSNNGNRQNIRVHGRFLNALIDQYVSGKIAKDKGLKVRCWSHSNEWLESLLHGYLSGDGHWDKKNKRWRLGFTRNYNLERDLRVLCARLGFSLTLNLARIPYNGKDVPIFRGEIRFSPSSKPKTEIVEIRKARCREVYDIAVEDEPHIFALASGLLTHNSNAMPESVTDRPSKATENIFLLSKSERYYFDAEAIKKPQSKTTFDRFGNGTPRKKAIKLGGSSRQNESFNNPVGILPNGRNRRTTDWFYESLDSAIDHLTAIRDSGGLLLSEDNPEAFLINPQSYKGSHFATWPEKLVEPCLLSSTSQEGVCGKCGAQWVREVEKEEIHRRNPEKGIRANTPELGQNGANSLRQGYRTLNVTTTGFRPSCSCNAPTVPALILDPFAGSGTTLQVAIKHRRQAIGFDLNSAYANELAVDRLDGTQINLF